MVQPLKGEYPMTQSDERLKALEQVAEAARRLTNLVTGSHHPGIEDERNFLLEELKKVVHRLDEIEGKREPVGKMEKWQEESQGAPPPKPKPTRPT
jgi:inhibitor of KinA sporulation pathway (predicted exonuclease)